MKCGASIDQAKANRNGRASGSALLVSVLALFSLLAFSGVIFGDAKQRSTVNAISITRRALAASVRAAVRGSERRDKLARHGAHIRVAASAVLRRYLLFGAIIAAAHIAYCFRAVGSALRLYRHGDGWIKHGR